MVSITMYDNGYNHYTYGVFTQLLMRTHILGMGVFSETDVRIVMARILTEKKSLGGLLRRRQKNSMFQTLQKMGQDTVSELSSTNHRLCSSLTFL